jgi:hypothetical protein
MVRQDVNGRAERDLSSPLSRVHLLKVPLCVTRTLDRWRWTETDDGRIPAETGRRNGEGSSISQIGNYDDDGEKWATVSIYWISSFKSDWYQIPFRSFGGIFVNCPTQGITIYQLEFTFWGLSAWVLRNSTCRSTKILYRSRYKVRLWVVIDVMLLVNVGKILYRSRYKVRLWVVIDVMLLVNVW